MRDFRVQGFGALVWGSGFRVRVQGFGVRVWDSALRVRVEGLGSFLTQPNIISATSQ